MKSFFFFMLMSFIALNNVCAQTNVYVPEKQNAKIIQQKNIEEIQQKHAEYLIKELGLTEEQSIKFSPMMKDYMQKRFELYQVVHKAEKKIQAKKNASNDDYNGLIDLINNTKLKEAKLEKHYHEELSTIMGYDKVLKYDLLHKKTIQKTLQNSGRKE